MKCKPDSYTALQGRPNSTLKYKDDLEVYLDYQPSSTQVEKPRATVEIIRCCRIWPHNLSEQGPRCCWGISAAARVIPMTQGGLFCLPWPFGLMVAMGQTSVGEPKDNILSRTMISGYESHVVEAPLGDQVFNKAVLCVS